MVRKHSQHNHYWKLGASFHMVWTIIAPIPFGRSRRKEMCSCTPSVISRWWHSVYRTVNTDDHRHWHRWRMLTSCQAGVEHDEYNTRLQNREWSTYYCQIHNKTGHRIYWCEETILNSHCSHVTFHPEKYGLQHKPLIILPRTSSVAIDSFRRLYYAIQNERCQKRQSLSRTK